jgi:hypothetical protein
MLHHLSISAENPENVAQVLAEIMGGIVVPFRPNPGSFMAFALDEYGTELEIHPAGTRLRPDGTGFVTAPPTELTATHFALSVSAPRERIFEIAKKQGWRCERTHRAEFPLVEMWIENRTLCELLPPEDADIYLEVNRKMRERVAQGTDPAAAENSR